MLRIQNRADWVIFASLVALIILCAVAFEYTDALGKKPGFSSVPLDDSWIHFVYARSMASSLRFDYNPGQSEAGFSSMLWVLALGPLLLLHIPAPLGAKLLGLAFQLGLCWVLFCWIRKYLPAAFAYCAAAIAAITPVLTYAALSGMEVMFYAFVLVGAGAFFVEAQYKTAAGFLAAVSLARPDGVVFVGLCWGIVALDFLLGKIRPGRNRAPRIADVAWIFFLPLVAGLSWMVYCFAATGRPLPASFYVRADQFAFFFNVDRFGELAKEIARACYPLSHFAKLLPAALGLVFLATRKQLRLWVAVLFPILFALVMSGETVQIIGGTFNGARYLVPTFPFWIMLQVFGAGFIFVAAKKGIIKRPKGEKSIAILLSVALLVALFFPPQKFVKHWRDMRQEFALSCQNIDAMQVRIGKWLAENSDPDDVIALFDAGAIRYISNRKAVDILGLNTHEIAHDDPRVVRDMADYLVTYPVFSKELAEIYKDREVFRVTLERNIASANETMVVYRVK